MPDLTTFRLETRAWLEANCPPSMRQPVEDESDFFWGGRNPVYKNEDQKLWFERMAARGWTVPHWPKEYGGGGLNKEEYNILKEEMRRLGCRTPLSSFGIWMLGPALLKFGSEEQKRRFLPEIARGQIRWCQGYSEPNAGSDLASLQTRARAEGDHYVVNGQKVWTSYADKSDWIFCLVRTDPQAPKHKGISFLLIDMASPGVRTRPIRLISGKSPFCETFFDQVRVPKAQLVGRENEGWTIAKYLLTHEREMIGEMGDRNPREKPLYQIALDRLGRQQDKLADPQLRRELAQLELDAAAFQLTIERTTDEIKLGQSLGAQSSMLKYYGTELNKIRWELRIALEGLNGLLWEDADGTQAAVARHWLRSKGNSIEGGTSEIQLNIIAKRILGLPVLG